MNKYSDKSDFEFNKAVFRAAMEVFLMIKDAE